MITKEYGKFVLVCDICGEEVGDFDTFDDALDYSRDEVWKSDRGEQLNLEDGWIDICPICGGRNE